MGQRASDGGCGGVCLYVCLCVCLAFNGGAISSVEAQFPPFSRYFLLSSMEGTPLLSSRPTPSIPARLKAHWS